VPPLFSPHTRALSTSFSVFVKCPLMWLWIWVARLEESQSFSPQPVSVSLRRRTVSFDCRRIFPCRGALGEVSCVDLEEGFLLSYVLAWRERYGLFFRQECEVFMFVLFLQKAEVPGFRAALYFLLPPKFRSLLRSLPRLPSRRPAFLS